MTSFNTNSAKTHNNKEPWLAVNLSYFFAGIGQIYAGKIRRGVIMLTMLATMTVLALWHIFSAHGDLPTGISYAIVAGGLYLWNLYDAFISARNNNSEQYEQERRASRDPWLALLLSQIVPGFGHLYLRETIPGILLVGLSAILYVFVQYSVLLGILGVILGGLAGLHAYYQAPVRRENSNKPVLALVTAIIIYGTIATSIPFYFNHNIVRNFTTSSTDMVPSIYPQDRFFVRPLSPDKYKRGDIMVFEIPGDTTRVYVRRLVAFANEQVEIRSDSVLVVNGIEVSFPTEKNLAFIPGGQYAVSGRPFTVPANSYFFLADNSREGKDSRQFGAIKQSEIIGKVYKIYLPLYRAGPVE